MLRCQKALSEAAPVRKAALSLYLGFRKYQRPVLASYRICRLFR
jgi:hypothetical protein